MTQTADALHNEYIEGRIPEDIVVQFYGNELLVHSRDKVTYGTIFKRSEFFTVVYD